MAREFRLIFVLGTLAVLVILGSLVAYTAFADFREDTCFPLSAGCARVADNFVVEGEAMVKDSTPRVIFHDLEATDGDDNVIVGGTCTTTTSAAEDCDFEVYVQEGGAAAERRLLIDADGGITIGSSNSNSITFTTDGTGDGEISLSENSVGPDEVASMADSIVLCGQLPNSATGYVGPSAAAYLGSGADTSIGSTVCDALDSATEATADAPISTDFPAFKVSGFWCRISSDPTNDVTITARSAAADLTPSLTCTIAGSGSATSCSTTTASTTDVAAGATIAMKVVTTEDLSLQDIWCKLYFAVK